jgi:hypothetical protein
VSGSAIGAHQDGLDVTDPDTTTPEEIAAYRAEYLGTNKGLLDSYEFWLEFRPDVLKRHKARTRHYASVEEPQYPLVQILAAIHQYAIRAFQEGIAYEIRLARTLRATRADILDTLSVPFIHSGHPGMSVAAACAEELRTYEDPEPTEVPRHAAFLARHRPGLLKAYRNRYEHAIRDSLPTQMLPYLLLNHDVVRGFGGGIRENVLLGRALGMTREQLLDGICFAVLHAGANALDVVDEAAGDLLATE